MTRKFLSAVLFSACIAAVGSLAQAQPVTSSASGPTAAPSGPQLGDGASAAYILGRDDVIEVGLLGRNDFGGRARVQADGTIQLPFIGKVAAVDRTAAELSDLVRKALQAGGYFADPVVTVEVVGYSSRYVTVLGSVGTPGLVPINRPYRLSDILARVGGVREGAADYLVVRSADGQDRRVLIRDLATGNIDQDPVVKAGDKIYSPTAETYFIYGQVNSSGSYVLTSDMTVRKAIAKGGGLTESGSDKKVEIQRDGKKVKVKLDDPIQAGDVLVIGERLF